MSKQQLSRLEFARPDHRAIVMNLRNSNRPRNHTDLIEALSSGTAKAKIPGPARPGKTRHDKARGVWSTANSKHGNTTNPNHPDFKRK